MRYKTFISGFASLLLCSSLAAQERIISLAPHITEVLFAVGAGDEIVGAVEYSDYPEAAKQIPRIGNSSQLNYEAIVALQPTLVIAWQSCLLYTSDAADE